MDLFVKGHQIV